MIHTQQMLDGADQGNGLNPLKVIALWFEGLPAELQTDLSSLISTILPELVPGEAEAMALGETASLFRRSLRANGSPAVSAIQAAAFSAAIDQIFLERSTQEAWLLYENFLKQFREAALGEGKKNAASLVQSMIDALPARSAVWIHQTLRWRLLRSHMSPELLPSNHAAAWQ